MITELQRDTAHEPAPARINGVALHDAGERPDEQTLRQLACSELLRQAAIRAELLDAADPPPQAGVMSEAASLAIEQLLDAALKVPEPDESACRRYYTANRARLAIGERVLARHVLFAVVPGVDIAALRGRAEACLLELRTQPGTPNLTPGEAHTDRFAEVAAVSSNCPSGAQGGSLGWLQANDCAPELARELFGVAEVGVLPRLVATRFGLHVVEVLAREPGIEPGFEAVREAVAQRLRQQAFATALRQYLSVLAGESQIEGVALEAADSPLVQ